MSRLTSWAWVWVRSESNPRSAARDLVIVECSTSAPKGFNELFWRNTRLTQQPSERANLRLAMHRHDAAFAFAAHDDVTAALTDVNKPETLERTKNLRSRDA